VAQRNAGDFEASVDSTIAEIRKEFGENLMSYSIHSLHEKA
jgi:hypothetical protein